MTTALDTGCRTLRLEGEAILAAEARLDAHFERAVELLAAGGRVIVSGIGKSGVIAQKIAATMTSTGTPASYLHPIESLHGDLGVVGADTVAIILSKSGETDELVGLIAELSRRAVPLIAIVGAVDSTLGRAATVSLDGSVKEEACPHDLAPTTSTAVAMALGDALAVALLERKGFRREDFAALHPGGRLGRRLLLRTCDVMVPVERLLMPTSPMRDVVVALSRGRGLAIIAEGTTLLGVISTGDLTRVAEQTPEFLEIPAGEVMTANPRTALANDLAATVVGLMERHGIVAVPVLDAESRIVGVAHLHDLLRAGVV